MKISVLLINVFKILSNTHDGQEGFYGKIVNGNFCKNAIS